MRAGWFVLAATLALTACGGGRTTGDVSKACMSAGRQAASPAMCSCVQQVANQSLTRSEQRRAAAFFSDPHLAQETRQSSRDSDRTFWQRYRAFVTQAEATCR